MVCFDCVHCKVCSLHKRYNEPCDYYEERKKKGKWEYTTHHARRYRVCSCCHAEREDDRSTGWNFCPACGARMESDV